MAQLWLKRRFVLLLTMMIVVLSLATLACTDDGDGIGPSPTPTATHRPSPTATPNAGQFVVANPTASEAVKGLALQLTGLDTNGPVTPLPNVGATCRSELLLTAPKPTALSATAVQQMRSYLMQLPGGYASLFPTPTVKPSSGLNWIPDGEECDIVLQVTNVTKSSGQREHDIEITGLDLRLASSPVHVSLPSIHDSLVDICTVVTNLFGCGYNGQGPGYSVYDSAIVLRGGSNGLAFPGTLSVSPFADPSLYTLPFILQPNHTRDITLTITVPAGTALAYQVVPELAVVGTNGSTSTFSFPALKTNLTFAELPAAAYQGPCYGLLTDPYRAVPDSQVNYKSGQFASLHSICF